MHDNWYERNEMALVPSLPLTVAKISQVACQMKSAGYRSYANYLSRAKKMHIQEVHPWSAQLAQEEKASIRSVLRGIGPPRQTAALDLNEVFGLNLTDEPLVEDGPVAMTRFFVFACFFVLREIEVPYALSAR